MNKNPVRSTRPARQEGVALAVALILLVVLTLLALSGVRLSMMELRMALNDELRIHAIEQAQSMVDATVRNFNNTPILNTGVVVCARSVTGCTDVRTSMRGTLPSGYQTDLDSNYVNVVIRSMPPLNAEPPVGTGFSLSLFDAAYLRVEGHYDKNTIGLGAAQVHEGIAVVYGSAGDISPQTGTGVIADAYGGATQ